jgi:hypothetical protein
VKLILIDRHGRKRGLVRIGKARELEAAVHVGPEELEDASEAYGIELDRWADDGGN